MKIAPTRRTTIAALCMALAIGGTATATAASSRSNSTVATAATQTNRADDALVADFRAVDRGTAWQLTGKLKLNFPTYHTEGITFAGGHIFLSAVQILEPTVKYPTPQGGYDRTPGRGIGHVFVMDTEGRLQRDIVLGEGDMYHPGGIDNDGTTVWVPVAQYRPNSSAIIYSIDVKSLSVHKEFEVKDHIGGIVRDAVTGHLVGNSWGSRHFYEWNQEGRQVTDWNNEAYFVDYQDCQYVPSRKMLCGGVTNLPQTPAAGGTAATYELGGIGLIDLRSHDVLHEVPLQLWSTAGHVVTRNPLKLAAHGDTITMWAAPDNGDEGNGTEILTYQATVNPAR
jgi:hypothetical protein